MNIVFLKHIFVLFVFKKSPKDCFEVMIDLASIFLYEFEKLINSFSESEKAKSDRCDSH